MKRLALWMMTSAPDLFTPFQPRLGLRLESANAPADILVIDYVERLSEN